MKIYSIEGNIGSGKTTLWNCIREESCERGVTVDFCPESAMSVFRSVPCLMEHYYNEPAKYCEELNARIIEHGCERLRYVLHRFEKVILDSSLLATRNVFLPSAIERNFLSKGVGEGMIKTIDDFLVEESIEISPIWLPTDPQICFDRINRRARPRESNITLDLLERHHDLYWRWFGWSGCTILPDSLGLVELNLGKLAQVLF